MLAHISVPVSDYAKAKKFYTPVLAAAGYKLTQDHPEWKAAGYKEGGHTSFWLVEKKRGPIHRAVICKSKRAVQQFHERALAAGGKDNGAPGFRVDYGPDYYAAFVHDQDGNNVEACYFGEVAPELRKRAAKKSVKKAAKTVKKSSKKTRR
jgi:predicted lactoylglutathione lyase